MNARSDGAGAGTAETVRLLVVSEYCGAPSVQDFLRARFFDSNFRKAGYRVRYVGRRVVTSHWHQLNVSPPLRLLRRSIVYKAALRVIDRVATQWNDGRIVRMAQSADTVYFIKTSSPRLVKRTRRMSRAKIVYDFSDPLWLPEFSKQYPDLAHVLAAVDCVTCDSEFTADYVNQFARASQVCRCPSQVEIFEQNPIEHKHRQSASDDLVIGWVGSTGTADCLITLIDSLERLATRHPNVRLRLLGISATHPFCQRLEKMRWSVLETYDQPTMVRELSEFDIGIHPVFDTSFGHAHGVLKPLLYFSAKAVVVASRTGFIPTVVEDNVNGLLANHTGEWEKALEVVVHDSALRARLTAAGSSTAAGRHSRDASFEDVEAALRPDHQ